MFPLSPPQRFRGGGWSRGAGEQARAMKILEDLGRSLCGKEFILHVSPALACSNFGIFSASTFQGSYSLIFNDGGGGGRSDRGSYFITKKIKTSEFVLVQKSLSPFLQPKKIPLSVFCDPKKSQRLP